MNPTVARDNLLAKIRKVSRFIVEHDVTFEYEQDVIDPFLDEVYSTLLGRMRTSPQVRKAVLDSLVDSFLEDSSDTRLLLGRYAMLLNGREVYPDSHHSLRGKGRR